MYKNAQVDVDPRIFAILGSLWQSRNNAPVWKNLGTMPIPGSLPYGALSFDWPWSLVTQDKETKTINLLAHFNMADDMWNTIDAWEGIPLNYCLLKFMAYYWIITHEVFFEH